MLTERPFPSYPSGWFAVALSDELAPSETRIVHYFGQDIVLFRTASGAANAVAPHCPHLGAHLGHGGRVMGESLRCPFHGWSFDGTGRCVGIPGGHKIPPRAAVRTWPLLEQNGVLFVHYHPAGAAPSHLPVLDEDGWTENRSIRWTVRTHPQEIMENTVDIAHLDPVHGAVGARVVRLVGNDSPVMNVLLAFTASGESIGMPGQDNDVELDVTMHGLGHAVVHTSVLNISVNARQRIYSTPIDEHRTDILGVVNTRRLPDPEFTKTLADLFYSAFTHDFVRDFPIWENKVYLKSPQLSAGDGPVGVYRRWVKQFYVDAPAAPPERAAAVAEAADAPKGPRRLPLLGRVLTGLREIVAARRSPAPRSSRPETDAPAPSPPSPSPEPRTKQPLAAPAGRRVETVNEYFDTLDRRFVPDASHGVDAVFQWEILGSDGGTYHVTVRGGAMTLARGSHEKPTVTITMKDTDYVRMVNGDIDGKLAFVTGKGKVSGSIPMAMKMQSIFPAVKPA